MLNDPSDFYQLTYDDLVSLDRVGDRKAQNMLEAIDNSKDRPLNRVLAALGIREVGRTASRLIAEKHLSMDRVMELTKDELMEIPDIGSVMAGLFVNYMAKENNRDMIRRLQDSGVNMAQPVKESANSLNIALSLDGMNICATGKFTAMSRNEVNSFVESLGGKAQSSVNKSTNILITGERVGATKINKALSLGVEVMSEAEFISRYSKDE